MSRRPPAEQALAHIHDDRFELEVPDDFQPRRFDHPVMQPARGGETCGCPLDDT